MAVLNSDVESSKKDDIFIKNTYNIDMYAYVRVLVGLSIKAYVRNSGLRETTCSNSEKLRKSSSSTSDSSRTYKRYKQILIIVMFTSLTMHDVTLSTIKLHSSGVSWLRVRALTTRRKSRRPRRPSPS